MAQASKVAQEVKGPTSDVRQREVQRVERKELPRRETMSSGDNRVCNGCGHGDHLRRNCPYGVRGREHPDYNTTREFWDSCDIRQKFRDRGAPEKLKWGERADGTPYALPKDTSTRPRPAGNIVLCTGMEEGDFATSCIPIFLHTMTSGLHTSCLFDTGAQADFVSEKTARTLEEKGLKRERTEARTVCSAFADLCITVDYEIKVIVTIRDRKFDFIG